MERISSLDTLDPKPDIEVIQITVLGKYASSLFFTASGLSPGQTSLNKCSELHNQDSHFAVPMQRQGFNVPAPGLSTLAWRVRSSVILNAS